MSSETIPSETVLSVSNLSKCYQIYDQPRHRLLQSLFRGRRKYFREFWALRDVSLEVKRGEVLGIIGRNGAGKSTLLQLICGTATATSGTVTTHGRVAALLELGAGFNPDFTGRENAFLNAAILGMTREETEARFDDIAAFAELGDFIDQPVKTYSSGMFVRLAFSVAIHVKPDILIVDEALSVGDFAFRNKCLERIQKLVAGGVTVLFVTHDISTLQLLCTRVLWLDHGHLRAMGDPLRVSQDYYSDAPGHKTETPTQTPLPIQQETGKAIFTDAHLVGERTEFAPGETVEVAFTLLAKDALGPIVFNLSVYRTDGDWVIGQTSRDIGLYWKAAAAGETRAGALRLTPLSLAPGDYRLCVGACSEDYSICYALTDLTIRFSVRAPFPTWGKFLHPIEWISHDG
jgi:ABC-type polysaccharide/polyol phosphate transport system ATPase subunit